MLAGTPAKPPCPSSVSSAELSAQLYSQVFMCNLGISPGHRTSILCGDPGAHGGDSRGRRLSEVQGGRHP